MGSINRITGLSGLDTQSMVDQMMQAARKPLDRLLQQQQLLLWKQQAYRTQNTSLTQLKDMVLNLKLQSSYDSKKANTTNNQVATAVATSNAPLASYTLKVDKLATAATNKSAESLSIRSSIVGENLGVSETEPININATNNQFTVVLDGIATDITLDNGDYNSLADLAAAIQTKLDAGGFADPVYVKASSGGELIFGVGQKSDGGVHTLILKDATVNSALGTLGFTGQDNSKALTSSALTIASTNPIEISANSNTFKMTVGSVTQTITIADGSYTSLDDFALAVEDAITGAFGPESNVHVQAVDGQLRIVNRSDDPTVIKLESGGINNALTKMGFAHGTVSDYPKTTINTAASIWDMRDRYANATFFADKTTNTTVDPTKKSSFGFAINGQSFSFAIDDSLDKIMQTINSNSAAGVRVRYDEFNDKFIMTTTKTGNNNEGGNEIDLTDPDGFLTQLMQIDPSQEEGGDNAKVWVNGIYTEKKLNTFTMDNVTFTLTGEGLTTVSVSSNAEGMSSQIEEFVNKYNEIINQANEEITKERAKSGKYNFYEPLTAEQKETLSEDEIKAWEEKAKQGILRNDTLLSGAINELRTGMTRAVYTPRTISGLSLSGTINLIGANTFIVTYGSTTQEISLTEASYDLTDSTDLKNFKADLQNKLDLAFGYNAVKVDYKHGSVSLTSNNVPMTLAEGSHDSGLSRLGFTAGAMVSATYNKLSDIGITVSNDWKENGKLYFDKAVFEAAVQNDPDGVMKLLTNSGEFDAPADMTESDKKELMEPRKGIFYKIHEALTSIVGKLTDRAGLTGTMSYENTLGRDLTDVNEKINNKEDWLSSYEERLWRRFSAMEAALNKYNAQMQYITNTLGGGY